MQRIKTVSLLCLQMNCPDLYKVKVEPLLRTIIVSDSWRVRRLLQTGNFGCGEVAAGSDKILSRFGVGWSLRKWQMLVDVS